LGGLSHGRLNWRRQWLSRLKAPLVLGPAQSNPGSWQRALKTEGASQATQPATNATAGARTPTPSKQLLLAWNVAQNACQPSPTICPSHTPAAAPGENGSVS